MVRLERTFQVEAGYEFRDPSQGLVVRGAHPEWVLLAAAEVIGNLARLHSDALLAELVALRDLGAVAQSELATARIGHHARFDTSPRCNIALGLVEYLWSSAEGPCLKPGVAVTPPLTLGPALRVAPPPR